MIAISYMDIDEIVATLSIFYFMVIFIFGRTPIKNEDKGNYHARDVTVVIPVYNQDEATFLETIESLAKQGVKFLVVGDGCSSPYLEITRVFGGEFLQIKHSGKRVAIAEGVKRVNTPLVMLLDSDTIMENGGIEKLASKFDERTGGITPNVESLPSSNTGVFLASRVMDFFRKINFRVLSRNGGLMVLNGQCSLFKTDVIRPFLTSGEFLKTMDGFYGDDREITMYLKSKGYKVLVEETVTALTVPPKNFKGLVKQMMRWFRAGYYYYFKEMKERVARNPVYFYVLSYWYFLPLLVLTEDILAGSYFLIHFLRILNHVLAYHGSGIPLITDVFALRRALLVTAIHGLRLLRMEMGTIQVNTTVDVIDSLMELTVLSAMIYSLKVKVKDIIYPLLAFPLMFVTSIVALMSLLAREGLRRVNQG